MKANAKMLGPACVATLSWLVAVAQFSPTNSTTVTPQPSPVVHDDRQTHNSPTNEIVEPAGAPTTNRVPDVTNNPAPLKRSPSAPMTQ